MSCRSDDTRERLVKLGRRQEALTPRWRNPSREGSESEGVGDGRPNQKGCSKSRGTRGGERSDEIS